VHGFTLDEQGNKMSKSLGNVVDPRDIVEGSRTTKKTPAMGVDVLRFVYGVVFVPIELIF
jgi:isoleucyl-tRNA synthetase